MTFALVTHSEGGITEKDVAMARDINSIVGRLAAIQARVASVATM